MIGQFDEDCTSNVKIQSSRAELIRKASLIIWDEFPMADKVIVEAVDHLLRTLMDSDEPFGGKLFVALGDWRPATD